MSHDSWLMTHDSWLMTHDSWLTTHDSCVGTIRTRECGGNVIRCDRDDTSERHDMWHMKCVTGMSWDPDTCIWRECHVIRIYNENKRGNDPTVHSVRRKHKVCVAGILFECGGNVMTCEYIVKTTEDNDPAIHSVRWKCDDIWMFKECRHIYFSTARCVLQGHRSMLFSLYIRMSWHSRHIRIIFPPHTPDISAARCVLQDHCSLLFFHVSSIHMPSQMWQECHDMHMWIYNQLNREEDPRLHSNALWLVGSLKL